ncbi:MAG: hypothetical protein JXA00_05590 [Candidatus Thermoplasmatota archaeon]|nr:hypothetical protein [Candidatus Thermoplasmatota archaeon]
MHHQVARVEQELDEWKLRYVTELQYWKETYASLQQEYHTQVKDTTRRIDEKFDRIMFYVEELRRIPPHTIEPSSVSHVDHQKEKRSSSLVRM